MASWNKHNQLLKDEIFKQTVSQCASSGLIADVIIQQKKKKDPLPPVSIQV